MTSAGNMMGERIIPLPSPPAFSQRAKSVVALTLRGGVGAQTGAQMGAQMGARLSCSRTPNGRRAQYAPNHRNGQMGPHSHGSC
jgi:hypothetical protein